LLCFFISAPVFAQTPATNGKPVRNITLTDASDVADAAAVDALIDVLVKKAASCPAASSKDRQACACSFKADLRKLRAAYDVAVAKHPGWNEPNVAVAYLDVASGNSVTLNFPGVKRQLDACSQHHQ
jgi:hypothetical protein